MADQDLQALERFLSSQSATAFTPGSELHYYFSLLHTPLAAGFEDLLKKFESAYPDSELVQRVKLRTVLRNYEEEKDEGRKGEWLAKLNDEYMHFTFDVPVPTASSEATLLYPSSLDPSLLAIDLSKASNDVIYFQTLSPLEYPRLDISLLSDSVFLEFISRAEIHRYPDLVPRLATAIETQPSVIQCVNRLTLEQINRLVELKPALMDREEIVSAIFLRRFLISDSATVREKVEVRREALAWIDTKFAAEKRQLTFDILTLSAYLGEYPEEAFIEYLTLHDAGDIPVIEDEDIDYAIPQFRRYTKDELIAQYLERLLSHKDDFSQFSPYLSPAYLSKQFARAKILSGCDPTSFCLSPTELEAIASEVTLELSADNPEVFPRASAVSLRLFTKNVPTLIVKVMQVDALAYSLATHRPVSDNIRVDGVEATFQQVIDCGKEHKCVKRLRDVAVPWLTGKAGLFVVELFGNGLHTRALIKKGHLKLVSKVTPAGMQMTVLNEANEVCVEKGAGIYVDSRLYELREEQRTVVVPFSEAERMNVAVISDGVVADCVNFLHRTETYELKCGFILMEESLQPGSMSSVSILPKLFVSGIPAPKELLKEPSVTIEAVDLDGISSSKKYSRLTIPDGEEVLTVEFEVPTKTVELTIQFSCEVTPMSTHEPRTITADRTLRINESSGSMACKQLFLRKCGGEFYVQVLGKNGEPCAKEVVSMNLDICSARTISDCWLSTDAKGLIRLGDLHCVSNLQCKLLEDGDQASVEKSWSIESFRPVVQYPSLLILCEGDSFGLPFPRNRDKVAPLSQLEAELRVIGEQDTLISASSAGLTYDSATEMITLSDLSAGRYLLSLGTAPLITVEVHKGVHWGNHQFILTDSAVIPTCKQYRSLMVSSVTRQDDILSVVLAGDFQHAVVHVLFHSFLSSSVRDTYQSIADMASARVSETLANPEGRSRYLASETLAQEYRYVLERQLQEKFTGNTLPKPQLLLKPALTQVSHAAVGLEHSHFDCIKSCCSRGEAEEKREEKKKRRRASAKVSDFMDFLLTPAVARMSCPVSDEGKASIQLPDGSFSLVSIFAVNTDATALLTTDLQTLSLETKDLALKSTLNCAKTYAETQKSSVIRAGDLLTVTDIATASLQVIDSIDKLSQLLVQVSKLSGAGLCVDEWEFLGRWHLLSVDEKHQKYEKYCSHELNLYLSTKDPQYFATVVRPLLCSKLEKRLIDHFLLGDSLDSYLDPVTISSLNCLELALLANRCKHSETLRETVINKVKVLPKDDVFEQKLFDAVLKFNIEGADKDDLSQFLSEEKQTAVLLAEQNDEIAMLKDAAVYELSSAVAHIDRRRQIMVMERECEMAQTTTNLGRIQMDRAMESEIRNQAERISCSSTRASAGFRGRGGPSQSRDKMVLFGKASQAKKSPPKEESKNRSRLALEECDMRAPSKPELQISEDFDDGVAEDILSQRDTQRPYFKQMDATKEYAETHYFGLVNYSEFPSRVPLSKFWAELLLAPATDTLTCLSPSVLYATANLTTYVAALAFTDLPLQPGRHGFVSQNLGVQIKASTNLIAFHKSIDEAPAALQDRVLCTQRFFHTKERHITNAAGEKEEKPVEEFVAGTVYGCQVIVTNVSVATLPAHVLVQIAEGALPVATLNYTKSHLMLLQAYETKTIEHFFYFPVPGVYVQAPVNVSVSGKVICASLPLKLKVVSSRSVLSSDSLKDIAASGDIDLVTAFLQTHSSHTPEVNLQLNSLLWMLKDKSKYSKLVTTLREQQCFHREVWAYSILHRDEEAIRELLAAEHRLITIAGVFLTSSLLTTDCLQARHLDYIPMVNARAYRLASQPRIANEQFKSAYFSLLFTLAHKAALESADYLSLIQYLVYQDRIPEAKRLIPNVGLSPSEGAAGTTPLQLQFDYMMCYLDADVGRTVAPLYANYPIPMWRHLFGMVRKQFGDEGDDKAMEAESLSSSLSFTVERGRVRLTYANLTQVTVRLYEIDIEVLFSRNPFFMKDTELFTYVCPNATYHLDLKPSDFEHELDLEGKWTRSNIFVEVEYDGKKSFQAYYSSRLTVHVIEQYGLVHVLDSSDHGVPRTYVKVFSKDRSGRITFYKDGYTDIRGKFDYVSLNTNQLDQVEMFAMLVTQDELGATVVTAKPPAK